MRYRNTLLATGFVSLCLAPGLAQPLHAGDFCSSIREHFDSTRQQFERLVGIGDEIDVGLSFVTPSGERSASLQAVPERMVVLVHGLDDFGLVWRDLIPALQAQGVATALLEYRDDGPVADAADLLAAELQALHAAGVQRVDVIGYSMGGLVARDVLTRETYYDGDGTGGGRYPALDRLILLGTPNHGSSLVAMRGLTEFTEHMVRAWGGHTSLFDWSEDGRGEAAEDLQPDSEFLRGLNTRPLGTHTRYTIIAATTSPLSEADIRTLDTAAEHVERHEHVPPCLATFVGSTLGGLSSQLRAGVRGLGDGVVTVDSALLEGVEDVVILEANHVDMVFNVVKSDRTPPAIPVILDRLAGAAHTPNGN
jgi:pimeloyl-ACP methyl ester carboxylesterase